MATTKRGATRLDKRAASAEELKVLLTRIPKVAPDVAHAAAVVLMNAADNYTASQPIVDCKDRRSKPSLAESRSSVAALHKYLSQALEQLTALPLDARMAIGQATNAPLGKMCSDIEQVRKAVEQAMGELSNRPHKTADAARNVLAYEVAVVFRDVLKVKLSSTSEKQLTPNMSTGRGGAAYARVLRATLKVAGVTSYDPGPLIKAGLRLLEDPVLPLEK